eukprot:CAMPEP_0175777786 /NCGR_PEP_ID=MMETSP0097-20121207/75338_1 /TAXON_ID=311494 /ORGANISM="Alexandrium monilatum, Strain CCMP3105" /LENGTH=121 /DNA_ID=CAMNT_0017088369 /DNA_START=543 /DNA_END=905 /DNA_ORIENTATION=-
MTEDGELDGMKEPQSRRRCLQPRKGQPTAAAKCERQCDDTSNKGAEDDPRKGHGVVSSCPAACVRREGGPFLHVVVRWASCAVTTLWNQQGSGFRRTTFGDAASGRHRGGGGARHGDHLAV